jgi:hypothetical protein
VASLLIGSPLCGGGQRRPGDFVGAEPLRSLYIAVVAEHVQGRPGDLNRDSVLSGQVAGAQSAGKSDYLGLDLVAQDAGQLDVLG